MTFLAAGCLVRACVSALCRCARELGQAYRQTGRGRDPEDDRDGRRLQPTVIVAESFRQHPRCRGGIGEELIAESAFALDTDGR